MRNLIIIDQKELVLVEGRVSGIVDRIVMKNNSPRAIVKGVYFTVDKTGGRSHKLQPWNFRDLFM
jgi:hypothetical protein